MGTYIFLQLFGMACKLPVALNTDMLSVAYYQQECIGTKKEKNLASVTL